MAIDGDSDRIQELWDANTIFIRPTANHVQDTTHTTDIGPGGSGLWFRNVSDLPNPKWCDPAPYFSWHGILTGERVEIPFGNQTLLAKSPTNGCKWRVLAGKFI